MFCLVFKSLSSYEKIYMVTKVKIRCKFTCVLILKAKVVKIEFLKCLQLNLKPSFTHKKHRDMFSVIYVL